VKKMSLGLESPEEECKLILEHLVMVYRSYEEMFFEGRIPLDDYLSQLKDAIVVVPVHEFYQRLQDKGKISRDDAKGLLQERTAYLKRREKELKLYAKKHNLRVD